MGAPNGGQRPPPLLVATQRRQKPRAASSAVSAIAVKVAVPRAAPTWVAELAIPEAKSVCVSGTADATTIVVGVKLSATPVATRSRSGKDLTGVARWRERQPR